MDIKQIYWASTFILWIVIIFNYFNNKKLRNKLIKSYRDFVKKNEADYSYFVKQYNERADLLSRENHKVRIENEKLKERLRDLGNKDFDVM